MTTVIRPVGRNILVKSIEEKQTATGLYLPDSVKKGPEAPRTKAVVLQLGPKCEEGIQAGDLLILSSGNVVPVKDENGAEFYLVHETQVVGVKRAVSEPAPELNDELPF